MELNRNSELTKNLVAQYWAKRNAGNTGNSNTSNSGQLPTGTSQSTGQSTKKGLEAFPADVQAKIKKAHQDTLDKINKDFPNQNNPAYRIGKLQATKALEKNTPDVFADQVMQQLRSNREKAGKNLKNPATDAEIRLATQQSTKALRTDFESNLKQGMRSAMGMSTLGRSGGLANYLA